MMSTELWYFLTPSSAKYIVFVYEFAAFLEPPLPLPSSLQTAYMEAPFGIISENLVKAAKTDVSSDPLPSGPRVRALRNYRVNHNVRD